ncbi:hypothetical protein OC846_001604 [Tilletia horrida]|uniref:Major facilitator superfamily (MFS) profile domain-containing protein n=1 Tax=Tilletia horrida TaxID=155126 RepID=A0AAN6JTP2_9BASI|nr:hypothetical protein OC846_001604 [Tilletia horrida]KAK0569509.1 hypothetical protein OC861_000882 [Tilletia horrida]
MSDIDVEKQAPSSARHDAVDGDTLRDDASSRSGDPKPSSTPIPTSTRPGNEQQQEQRTSSKAKATPHADGDDDDDERYLVTFAPDDPANPHNYSKSKKWAVVLLVFFAATSVTCASSMTTSAYDGISNAFGVGREVSILSLSLFVAGLGIGPSLLGPLSEFFGRRIIYLVSYGAYVLLGFPVAWANNIAVFLIFRFLTGFASSGFLSIAGGTVSDVFPPSELFLPMALFVCATFGGPTLGPLIAGFINQNTTWRWTFYLIIIWAGAIWFALLFFTPETYAPTILCQTAARYRKERKDGSDRWWAQHERVIASKSISDSILSNCTKVAVLLSQEPMLLALCVWSALLLGILYLTFEAFPIIFAQHNFSLQQVGLTFIGLGIGILLSVFTMPYWARKYALATQRAQEKGEAAAPPEARLPIGMAGALLTTVGLYWIAFTSYASVHWVLPIIGSVFFGAGTCLAYVAIFSFTVDAFRPVAASAMSANSFVRSCFAAAFPLFSEAMYHRLGTVGATALLAGLSTLFIPIPFVFYKYGPALRARGRFSRT